MRVRTLTNPHTMLTIYQAVLDESTTVACYKASDVAAALKKAPNTVTSWLKPGNRQRDHLNGISPEHPGNHTRGWLIPVAEIEQSEPSLRAQNPEVAALQAVYDLDPDRLGELEAQLVERDAQIAERDATIEQMRADYASLMELHRTTVSLLNQHVAAMPSEPTSAPPSPTPGKLRVAGS